MNEHTHRDPLDKVCGYEYTVRRGDSFYLIANRLGIPLRDLLEANNDINPARLMVGDVLCIPMEEDDKPQEPAPPETPSIPEEIPPEELLPDESLDIPARPPEVAEDETSICPESSRYTLLPGETAADIQLRADINRYTLQNANPTADLDSLTAGQVLCVPSVNRTCPTSSTYTLQAEDSLESVALRLNTSLSALLRANPCLAPSDFTAGRCIHVPQ